MNPVAIVTLTRFPEIFNAIARSVSVHETIDPDDKFVVTSNLAPFSFETQGWMAHMGTEPFVWARNANLGIRASGDRDVLLTNDDVQWTQPTVAALRAICEANPSIGVLAPQVIGDGINCRLAMASTPIHQQWAESAEYIPFVCVYLPRRVLDAVGPFDESFTGYGGDDMDYCLRVQKAGFKLAVTPRVKVKHGFGDRKYSSSFLRVMSESERNSKTQESMRRVKAMHP
jgi:hypothetical protein